MLRYPNHTRATPAHRRSRAASLVGVAVLVALMLSACSGAPAGSTDGSDATADSAALRQPRRNAARATTTVPKSGATTPTTTAPKPGTTTPTTTAPKPGTTPTTTTAPQATPAAPSVAIPPGATWKLAFSEEFSGTSIDTNRLTPCFSWAWTYEGCTVTFNNGREAYQPGQVRVADGVARLVAEPNNQTIWGKDYRSGLLSTTNRPMSSGNAASLYKFRYGYVEGRMRVPRERGLFSAFWMLPPDYHSWDYPYEIDILETLGSTDRTSWMHVHHTDRTASWTPNANGGNGACSLQDYSDGFHTYGVDWQPTYIDFYIDGQRCGRFTGPIWKGDMEIIVNLMVDVDWQRQLGLQSKGPVTGSLDVDYIRVWQHQDVTLAG